MQTTQQISDFFIALFSVTSTNWKGHFWQEQIVTLFEKKVYYSVYIFSNY